MHWLNIFLIHEKKLYISPSINEKQISPLLIEHTDENVQQILRFIVTKDIIIVNDGSLKLEEFMIEDEKSEKDNEIMFISTNQSKFGTNRTVNQMDHNEAFEKPIANKKTVVEIEDPVLFKTKKSLFNKYLDKVDLVEIVIREPLLSNNHEKQI